jgi:hypothetical protein
LKVGVIGLQKLIHQGKTPLIMINSSEISKSEFLKESIFDLLNLIERANNSIARHKSIAEMDMIAVEGFERIRQQYIDELNQMMLEFGLHVDNSNFAMAA